MTKCSLTVAARTRPCSDGSHSSFPVYPQQDKMEREHESFHVKSLRSRERLHTVATHGGVEDFRDKLGMSHAYKPSQNDEIARFRIQPRQRIRFQEIRHSITQTEI